MSRGTGPIHYVSRRFPKLTETFVVEELLGLEAAGERVIIDSLEEPLDEPRHPGVAQINAEVRYVPRHPNAWEVRFAHLPLALRRPRTWLRLARHAKATDTWSEFRRAGIVARRTVRERARHVHTHFAYYCADVGGMAAALSGRTFTLTAHANDIWQEHSAPHLPRRLAYADGAATSTEYNARHIQALAPHIPVRAVRCAIAPADPAPAPPDGPILCIARLVPKKAVDLLIEALLLLPPEHAGLRLELIGEGPLEDELRALAARLGVEDRIDFRGAQPPDVVADAYQRCSVFCLPCRIAPDGDRDSLRVVLLEALACGLPVITTDAIEPEVVQDGITGRVVAGESPQALADAIAELVSNRELARRLGEEGRRRVREEITREAATAAMRWLFDVDRRATPTQPERPKRRRRRRDRQCECCGGRFEEFEPHGRIPRLGARCPGCGSLERHRALCKRIDKLFDPSDRVLHFAPEPGIERNLRQRQAEYVTSDIEGEVDVQADITRLPFADEEFDAILISHVLEHVSDDRAALRELRRVLRPGGRAIMQHPLRRDLDATVEDPSVMHPLERLRAFGQEDHVRVYSEKDFAARVKEAGFKTRVLRTRKPGGDIYVCTKVAQRM
jgi:glycosyltransferase involved in cell wall biosynthesis